MVITPVQALDQAIVPASTGESLRLTREVSTEERRAAMGLPATLALVTTEKEERRA